MTKILILCSVLIFSAFAADAQKRYDTYANGRFLFTIDYPSDLLTMQDPPANGDGSVFLSRDGSVEMRAWAGYNAMSHTVKQECKWTKEQLEDTEITYERIAGNWFVLSGVSGNHIYYRKTLYHNFGNSGVFFTFTIKYPKAERARFDAVVKRIERSFRFDPKADV